MLTSADETNGAPAILFVVKIFFTNIFHLIWSFLLWFFILSLKFLNLKQFPELDTGCVNKTKQSNTWNMKLSCSKQSKCFCSPTHWLPLDEFDFIYLLSIAITHLNLLSIESHIGNSWALCHKSQNIHGLGPLYPIDNWFWLDAPISTWYQNRQTM